MIESSEELAIQLVKDGELSRAAPLYGFVDAMRVELDAARREREMPVYNDSTGVLRAQLGAGAFATATAAGAVLEPRDVARLVAALPRPPSRTPEPPKEPAGSARPRLTDRELDVLRLVAAGRSSREIADILFISPRTATTHVEHILAKLDVKSRSAAVAVAMREGFIQDR